jgi:hypothetical protein
MDYHRYEQITYVLLTAWIVASCGDSSKTGPFTAGFVPCCCGCTALCTSAGKCRSLRPCRPNDVLNKRPAVSMEARKPVAVRGTLVCPPANDYGIGFTQTFRPW